MRNLALILIISAFLISCGGSGSDNKSESSGNTQKKVSNINISILLDLSDRIDTVKYSATPQHYVRDINDIKTIADIFKKKIEIKKLYDLKDKIKVFFHPQPEDVDIVNISSKLNIDLSEQSKEDISKVYDNIESIFTDNANQLYKLVLKRKNFPGSNTWRFIKDNINQCIDKDSSYRNVLVIITDGYMYWPTDQRHEKNRYNYIEREYDHLKMFRQSDALQNKFDTEDYGFIPAQTDLSSLEILVLGVAPDKNHPEDFDILKKYWEKWFAEMKVKKYQIVQSDLPINTEKIIKGFFE